MRAVADGALSPLEAVKAYHDALLKQGIAPASRSRRRQRDHRGRAQAGVGRGRWSARQRRRHRGNVVRRLQQVDRRLAGRGHDDQRRAGGRPPGRRLRLQHGARPQAARSRLCRSRRWASSATTTTARFLFAQCDAAGVERAGLMQPAGRGDDDRRRLQREVEAGGARISIIQGVAAATEPRPFRFLAHARAGSCISACPARTSAWTCPGAARPTAGRRRWRRRAREGIATNLEMMSTDREQHRRAGAALPAASRSADRQRLRDRRVAGIETRRDGRARSAGASRRARRGAAAGADASRRRPFPRGRDRGDARRRRASPSARSRAARGDRRRQRRRRRFRRRRALRIARGARGRRRVAARPRLRRRVDARGLDHRRGRQRSPNAWRSPTNGAWRPPPA